MKHIITLLAFICATALYAQRDFITKWSNTGSQIRFKALTDGRAVTYVWMTNKGQAGQGSFVPTEIGTVLIDRLRVEEGDTLTLVMSARNLRRFYMDHSSQYGKIIEVSQWGDVPWTSMQKAFYLCGRLQVTASDVPDLRNVEDMSEMFSYCTVLKGLPISIVGIPRM